MEGYTKHISSKHKLFNLKLKEVWDYRDLIILFTKRSFKVAYKQTILGPLWLFINPICTSVFQMILFGGIAKLSTSGIPQILFYLSGNAIWGFYSSCLTGNASTFTGNASLFGKVYFPRLVVPISNVLSTVVRFLIQMCMSVVLLIWFMIHGTVTPHLQYILLLPIVLLWLGILGMGIGIIISSMTTKYRDLAVLVGFGTSLWMYATPIVYPLASVPEKLYTILLFNPVTMPVEIFRYVFLGTGTIIGWSVLLSVFLSIILMFSGIILFNKIERTFMDTV